MEEHITSKTETIGFAEQRELLRTVKTMMPVLSTNEYIKLMLIFGECADRLLKENNME